MSWDDAVAKGSVKNLAKGIQDGDFGADASAVEIEEKWRAGPYVKLFPGTYVAKVGSAYIINGFYARMREKFISAPRGVAWKVVTWDSENLSWDAFRTEIVGATNPEKAAPKSLRGLLFANFSLYGLEAQPSGSDNGFHASASPLESLNERMIWILNNALPDCDPLISALAAKGCTSEQLLRSLCHNPSFPQDKGTPVFDVVEHTDTSECARLIAERANARK